MIPDTKDFLLREYEQIWKHVQEIWTTRNQIIGLYFAIYGGLAGAGLALVSRQDKCDGLACLPGYFVLIVAPFLVVMSAVASLLMIRLHTLTAEYVTTLNYIRKAFLENDREFLGKYSTLPTEMKLSKVYRINFYILLAPVAMGGVTLAFLLLHTGKWSGLAWILAVIMLVIWEEFWRRFYGESCRLADAQVKKRVK